MLAAPGNLDALVNTQAVLSDNQFRKYPVKRTQTSKCSRSCPQTAPALQNQMSAVEAPVRGEGGEPEGTGGTGRNCEYHAEEGQGGVRESVVTLSENQDGRYDGFDKVAGYSSKWPRLPSRNTRMKMSALGDRGLRGSFLVSAARRE